MRGWELDRLISRLVRNQGASEDQARARLSDAMLRYSLFQPGVDRLIVAIRRIGWVRANVESMRRGPLSTAETPGGGGDPLVPLAPPVTCRGD